MLKKLQYDLENDTYVQDLPEVASLSSKNKESLNRNAALRHNPQYTIMDLVAIFTDEADKVCTNKDIANLIALESLNDYVKGKVSNIKFVL
ncbi:MAG: hypothetical protein R2549_01370 [Candidatus Scalindua sp.]|jgi:hypothetical protein|nr:hypothetical protein [Candidatus Scalindua sp.]